MRTATKLSLVVLALMAFSAVAQAQTNNASITASAVVQTPINVTAGNNLTFGNVFPGVAKVVAVADAGAGSWSVVGQASANVNLTFNLPATLSDGANTLPIASYTAHHNTVNAPAGGTNFTPSAVATSTALSAGGLLFVFIGATVTPATNQAAGTYTGSLTMTVVYF
jgi:uncharacterized protein DUF4402